MTRRTLRLLPLLVVLVLLLLLLLLVLRGCAASRLRMGSLLAAAGARRGVRMVGVRGATGRVGPVARCSFGVLRGADAAVLGVRRDRGSDAVVPCGTRGCAAFDGRGLLHFLLRGLHGRRLRTTAVLLLLR